MTTLAIKIAHIKLKLYVYTYFTSTTVQKILKCTSEVTLLDTQFLKTVKFYAQYSGRINVKKQNYFLKM